MNRLKQIIGYSLIFDIILIDQLSKWGVLEYILKPAIDAEAQPLGFAQWLTQATERLGPTRIEISPFFNLTMVWNQGVSFGMFQSGNPWPLAIVALVISALFAAWLWRSESWLQAVSLGMVIGGALGNVIDRVRFGAVADFLDFHVFGWHYPAFNVADSCITLGIVFLVFDSLFLERKRKSINITS